MAYRVSLRPGHPRGTMMRAGREFTASPVILSDVDTLPAILNERWLMIEDLGRDQVAEISPAVEVLAVEPEKPKRKRR